MCAVLPVLSFGKDWDCIVDGTMYSLDDENKTAQVKYVGGENVFIPDYITNSGIKIRIVFYLLLSPSYFLYILSKQSQAKNENMCP